jgi:Glycosyl hydrolases family 18
MSSAVPNGAFLSVGCSHRHSIQGVSLDWFSAISTSHDMDLFSKCLQQASHVWKSQREKHQPLQISLSYYPMQTQPNVFSLVDRIQVMTYGLSSIPPQSSWTRIPNLVSRESQQAIQALIQAGCPATKIWLGVPFYAQAIRQDTHALNPILTYSDALAKIVVAVDKDNNSNKDSSRTSTTDIQQQLHKVLDGGYQWESPKIMRIKVDLVRTYSLGGLFVWELGQDGYTQAFPSGVALTELSQLARLSSIENEERQPSRATSAEL